MKLSVLSPAFLTSFLLALLVSTSAMAISLPEAAVYPVMSPRLSSGFGTRKHPIKKVSRHHDGVDLAAPKDSPVRAIKAGLIVYADPYGGYGKLVVVQHPDGMTTHYGHLNSIKAQPGKHVKAGEIIGAVGSTGHSTGPHLHLEFRKDGKVLNPQIFLKDLIGKAEG
jgi:murein DD-endopeptidase MepM/ murein hydrolase activator NlpD